LRLLAAVLPHTGRISFDVPGILRRLVEWWIEQWQDLCAPRDKSGANGIHRAFGEPLRNGSREHSPRLRDRIDLALVVLCRAERGPIVEVAAPVPFAVPSQLEFRSEAARRFSIANCSRAVAARGPYGGQAGEH